MAYRWGWVGAPSPSGFVVAARAGAGESMRLAVSTDPGMAAPTFFGPVVADSKGFAKLVATGLSAATQHYWQVEVGSVLASPTGKCKTFPTADQAAASFRIALWTCAGQNSNATNSAANANAYDAIRAKNPDITFCPGDIHYWNPVLNDVDDHLYGYADMFEKNPKLNQLLREIPNVYMWSDHDYAGNATTTEGYGGYAGNGNSDRMDIGRPAACSTFRQAVPHYPVRADGPFPAGTVEQKFKHGRIHTIVSDLRAGRDPDPTPHGPSKSMMGATQLAWFKQALLDAKADGSPVIFWVQETTLHLPRNSNASLGYNTDSWAAFHNERLDIARFIRDNKIPPIVSFQGDLHYAALRNRINLLDLTETAQGDPAAGLPHAPIMSIHASRLESNSAFALGGAGVWEVGPWNDQEGYYAIVDVTDDGTTVTVTAEVRVCDKVTNVDQSKGTLTRTFKSTTPPPPITGVSAVATTATGKRVRWNKSTDPAVLTYRVYKNGVLAGEVAATTNSLDV